MLLTICKLIILEILLKGKLHYTVNSLSNSIKSLDSFDELDGLLEYVQHDNFKKSSLYLVITGLLENNKAYEMDQLEDVGQSALGSCLKKTALKSKSIKTSSLILIRLVFET